ncbi:methylated-DNA--[protein]-cysteine S-methyltransferase [Helicobacter sp. MIT 21-1697]|uniref:methylated-DNA--[protein]-cysteine S-methyltransferase n=1 Tax=Helicobacter sp. MIT 21-1697 TaxID=2993733 RepID=UPI00224A66C0|nr:methylated-DNA--[protein]-cysteine S-methyltransferase [Helicobacter sp. MIT 21-1697]MCX2717455.1 methylated-DNA--[protein]-cysteine S-methyltransferase [Helicobacter sp. MIT 21-1697]
MNYVQQYPSPLGNIIFASDENALFGLWFEGQKHFTLPKDYVQKQTPILAQTKQWLELYFSREIPPFTPPLAPLSTQSTAFRESVWAILRTIPYGRTMSYKEIAQILAHQRGIAKMSAQAVGNAVGANPIALLIPCHRVIGSDKSLTGYAGGLKRKEWLLKLERENSKIQLGIL